MSDPEFYRVTEVARFLKVSRNTAYTLVRSGALPSVRVGSQLRVPKSALLALLAHETVGPPVTLDRD